VKQAKNWMVVFEPKAGLVTFSSSGDSKEFKDPNSFCGHDKGHGEKVYRGLRLRTMSTNGWIVITPGHPRKKNKKPKNGKRVRPRGR
jgi:hypothetical protein